MTITSIPAPESRWLDPRATVPKHLTAAHPGRHLRRTVTVLGPRRSDGRLGVVGEWWMWDPGTGDWVWMERRTTVTSLRPFKRRLYQPYPS